MSKIELESKVRGTKEQPEIVLRDFYEVNPPFGNVAIKLTNNQTFYETIEPTVSSLEETKLRELKGFLFEELKSPIATYKTDEIEKFLEESAGRLIKQYRLAVPRESLDKVM